MGGQPRVRVSHLCGLCPCHREAERKVLLHPHPLPLAFAHSARSISQVSMILETNVFVLFKNTSDGAWPHSCRKELELLSLQSGVQGPSAL